MERQTAMGQRGETVGIITGPDSLTERETEAKGKKPNDKTATSPRKHMDNRE